MRSIHTLARTHAEAEALPQTWVSENSQVEKKRYTTNEKDTPKKQRNKRTHKTQIFTIGCLSVCVCVCVCVYVLTRECVLVCVSAVCVRARADVYIHYDQD